MILTIILMVLSFYAGAISVSIAHLGVPESDLGKLNFFVLRWFGVRRSYHIEGPSEAPFRVWGWDFRNPFDW